MSEPEASEQQRLARNLNELLQELRIAQTGVQVLFGFLLSVAFTDRYARADAFVHVVHVITVMFAAIAVCFLITPAAWHRILFRHGRRESIVTNASTFAVIGLASLAAATTGTVLLIGYVVFGKLTGVVLGIGMGALFGSLWFTIPMSLRRR
ncbi:MAG: hypothetical protein JOZ47_23110 [Kutzneria sp.]|nr:hypothetical protein [Kutzneria sp.]